MIEFSLLLAGLLNLLWLVPDNVWMFQPIHFLYIFVVAFVIEGILTIIEKIIIYFKGDIL